MSRVRVLFAIAVVAGLTAVVFGAASAQDEGMPSWWKPPPSVRTMLGQISKTNLQQDVTQLVQFGTRHTLSSQTDPVRGIGAARDWIFGQLQQDAAASGGDMTAQLQTFVQPPTANIPVPTTITNVIATLRGTDPTAVDRVYVVSSHYDDRVTDISDFTNNAPGADDDASGVAAMLELARVMAAHPAKATIVFVAFDGEEQGLYGSSYFAAQEKAAGANVQADLNMDFIGSSLGGNGVSDPHTVNLYSEGIPSNATSSQLQQIETFGEENDGISRQLARYAAETGGNAATKMNVRLVSRRDRLDRSGDQISFDEQGYAGIRFTEPNENYNHEERNVQVVNGVQNGDLAEFLDFDYLTRVTRVVGSTLAALATSPRAPTDAQETLTPPSGFAGSSNTQLTWDADPESDVVGYEIVWRDTNDPTWTHALDVGNVTSYNVTGLNKDDTQFGVRAINSAGDQSPVAFAVPTP